MTYRALCTISLDRYKKFWDELYIRFQKKIQFMPIIKADGYGLGAIQLANSIHGTDAIRYFGVAIPEEGLALRNAGITTPLLCFTPPQKKYYSLFSEYNITPTLCTKKDAESYATYAKEIGRVLPVHIKVNTGMNRLGIEPQDIASLASIISHRCLKVEGIYTHLAHAENPKSANEQMHLFEHALDRLEIDTPPLIHVENSAAVMARTLPQYPMVRIGIASYLDIASLSSEIIAIRCINQGDSVGYEHSYTTQKSTQIATVSIGYADGIPRQFNGDVVINKKRYPVVGHVCMDMLMVDIGTDTVSIYDRVTFFESGPNAMITLSEFAKSSNRIPYESLCALSNRVKREYKKG